MKTKDTKVKITADDAINYLVKEMDLDRCSRRNYVRDLNGRRYEVILLASGSEANSGR